MSLSIHNYPLLALLLERTLDRRLGDKTTASRALEELATCNLNRYRGDECRTAYGLTEINPEQDKILRSPGLRHLADDDAVSDQITPR